MLHEYMKQAYDQLVDKVFDGQKTFSQSEGYEIFAAAFLLALKSTMTSDHHELLRKSTMAQVLADGFLTDTN